MSSRLLDYLYEESESVGGASNIKTPLHSRNNT